MHALGVSTRDSLPSTSHTHLNLTFEISLFSVLRPKGRGFRRLSDCPGNADTPAVSNLTALTTVPEPPVAVPCHYDPVGPTCSLHIRNLTAPRGMLGEVRAAVCPEANTYKSPKIMPSFHTGGPTGHDSAPPLMFSGEERYQGDLLEECSRLNGSPPKKVCPPPAPDPVNRTLFGERVFAVARKYDLLDKMSLDYAAGPPSKGKCPCKRQKRQRHRHMEEKAR